MRLKKTVTRSINVGAERMKWILVVVRVIMHDGRTCGRKRERRKPLKKRETQDELGMEVK